jgi:hypothetical protein
MLLFEVNGSKMQVFIFPEHIQYCLAGKEKPKQQ